MKLYFTKDHEWLRVEGGTATVGITDYAQGQLGDVVFVENPPVGAPLTQGKEAAVVESVKAASEVYAPITGEVTETNAELEGDPSLVNTAPEDAGWFFKMTVANEGELDGLMDEAAYRDYVKDL
jgi:glycine cleavage system H protein